jgi:hypothetical protein
MWTVAQKLKEMRGDMFPDLIIRTNKTARDNCFLVPTNFISEIKFLY